MGLAPLNGRAVGAIFFLLGLHVLLAPCVSNELGVLLAACVLAGFPCASWFPAPAGSYQPNTALVSCSPHGVHCGDLGKSTRLKAHNDPTKSYTPTCGTMTCGPPYKRGHSGRSACVRPTKSTGRRAYSVCPVSVVFIFHVANLI